MATEFNPFWRRVCALPAYSFISPDSGGVARVRDSMGNWLEKPAVQDIVDDAESEIATLRAALRNYIAAVDTLNVAMIDGVNVQGAIGDYLGAKEMAEVAARGDAA